MIIISNLISLHDVIFQFIFYDSPVEMLIKALLVFQIIQLSSHYLVMLDRWAEGEIVGQLVDLMFIIVKIKYISQKWKYKANIPVNPIGAVHMGSNKARNAAIYIYIFFIEQVTGVY